jgi:cyclopropane-fatty-acyl-phospholipid synthase
MWETYLACSEAAFRHFNLMVFQIQIGGRHDAVPFTRDDVTRAEARLREQEGGHETPLRLAGE